MDDQLNTNDNAQTSATPASDALNTMAPAGATAQDKMQQEVADELLNQDILKILKMDTMSAEKQEEIKQKMIDTILGRMIARIMDALSEEDKKGFEEILDKNDQAATEEFLKDKVNIRDILVQETMLYKAEMIDNAQKIDEMVKSGKESEEKEETPNTAIV